MPEGEPKLFRADFTSSFNFTRSTGPVIGRFLAELKNRRIVGIKGSDGKVIVPPLEYDPGTFKALSEFVEVQQTGVVRTWCWVNQPREKHLIKKPFAWALIQLDGSDTPMLHMVNAEHESAMSTGMRVKARWSDETKGSITDIKYFEPVEEG